MEETEHQEIVKNIKSTYNFMKKHYVIFLLLLLVAFNIYLRTIPFFLPATDAWASSTINSQIESSITSTINQEYPNLPQDKIAEIVAQEKVKYMDEHKSEIDAANIAISNQLKDFFRRDNGATYLLELDPYMWYKYAKDISGHGYPGDFIASEDIHSYSLIGEGEKVDKFSLAPFGKPVGSINFHPYFIYIWGLVFKPFGIDMMTAEFFIPVFLVSLAIFPIFFIVRKVAGDLGGFVAAFVMMTNVPFLSRAIGGFSDTDAYQVVMPLFIIWFLLEAYTNKKYAILFSALSAVSVAVFAFTWIGWSFIYNIIMGFFVLYGLILLVTKQSIKDHIKIAAIFFMTSLPLIGLVRGAIAIPHIILGPFAFNKMLSVATTKIWPNVLTTVAEQSGNSFEAALSVMGTKIFYIFIVLAVIYLFIKKRWDYLSMFPLWFAITFYIITKGTRYAQLSLPAFAILVGIGAGYLFNHLVELSGKHFNINKKWASGFFVIISFVLLFVLIAPAVSMAKQEIPMMNDLWWNGLQKIDKEASPNAIINSWWDMGHWFKAVGNRPSTFDGASQDSPPAYWIGKVLLTSNESEAIAILRMLVCGGNRAYDVILDETKDPLESIQLVKGALEYQDKEEAYNYLSSSVTKLTAREVIDQYMFCSNPPEDYFITSEDMIGKAGVWAHFGSWDFKRAKMYNDYASGKDAGYFSDYYNLSGTEANNLLVDLSTLQGGQVNDWIALWPSYFSGFGQCSQDNDTITCDNNLNDQQLVVSFNLTSKDANIINANAPLKPSSVVITIDNQVKEFRYASNETLPISISILPNNLNIISHAALGASMFNRLLNFEGKGLEHFEPFYIERSMLGERVYIWRVKW